MRRFLAGVVATVLIEASVALLVIGFGGAPVNADRPPSTFETRLLGTAVRASVARQAASESELRELMQASTDSTRSAEGQPTPIENEGSTSKAVGAPPRWTCPNLVTRNSNWSRARCSAK